ncbi:MAG: hypothetical protein JXR73_03710 [Candidatus Omnitrophica bacterium]|nr:hypothetical protein [Candidatus Omnitrophota bacterium]
MSSIINAMIVSGNMASLLFVSVFGMMITCLVIWVIRFYEKSAQKQPVSFYKRRVNQLRGRYNLNSKEMSLLRDFARMERQRRKKYYEYLNRNSKYF